MLQKCFAALKPGGRAVTLEFIPNEDRITPPSNAAFALIMLASTPAGDAYTFSELESMFSEAGFALHGNETTAALAATPADQPALNHRRFYRLSSKRVGLESSCTVRTRPLSKFTEQEKP